MPILLYTRSAQTKRTQKAIFIISANETKNSASNKGMYTMNPVGSIKERNPKLSQVAIRNGLNIVVLVAAVLRFGFQPLQTQAAQDELKPANGVQIVLDAFARYPIVAIGDNHGCEEEWTFITSLLRAAEFPDNVNDIGVEFGNALYQDACDRYIAGLDVPLADVQKIWRDTTQFITFDSPVYEQFFVNVREINKNLPLEKRLRVVLGDPPLDWSTIPDSKPKQEWGRAMVRRDSHFAQVIEAEILAKGRKALIISGGAHLLHAVNSNNTTGRIERKRPNSIFVVIPHSGFKESNEQLETRFALWKSGMIAPIKNTWLGSLHPKLRWPQMAGVKLATANAPSREPKLEDVADGWLFVGMRDSLTEVLPHPRIYRDDYWNELNRRHLIVYGKRIDDPENFQAEFKTSGRYYVKPK